MIVGNPSVFAIESEITEAYERLSFRALGSFVIHIMGRCYGVKEPDASLLAVSFDEVGRRIARRGRHTPPFTMDAKAGDIAHAFRRVLYDGCEEGELFFGMPDPQFHTAISSSRLQWAPDGDEAFDDGSYVLHFEDKNRVRLIAYKSIDRNNDLDPSYDTASLRDVWLSQNDFYEILQNWRSRFEAECEQLPKIPMNQDGPELNSDLNGEEHHA
jgi:hypothetical protein